MSVIIRRNQKLDDQVDIQSGLINIQGKRKEQEEERLFNMDITYFGNRFIRNVWL